MSSPLSPLLQHLFDSLLELILHVFRDLHWSSLDVVLEACPSSFTDDSSQAVGYASIRLLQGGTWRGVLVDEGLQVHSLLHVSSRVELPESVHGEGSTQTVL